MNWLDRAISWMNPQAGARRARARMFEAAAKLAYDGARTGRRTDGWITTGKSGNAEVQIDLAKLRERSRDIIRNNHFAARAAMEYPGKIVGSGITPRIQYQPEQDLWDAWQSECSADGLPHFGAVQWVGARTVFESGECLVRKRTRTASVADRMTIPIQIQVLEPDFLDASKTESLADGGYIIQGVEFNSWGQPVAYWLFPQHPGEIVTTGVMARNNLLSSRIPASEVLHIKDITTIRSGQVRGVPALAAVMLAMRDLDDWEDAEIVRKKTEACLAAIVVDPNGTSIADSPTGVGNAPKMTDAGGRVIESFAPGMIAYGTAGFDVKFNQPNYAGGYEEYKRSRVRDLATGCGMLYEILAGDLSQTNYSSYRSGLLSFRDRIEALQWNVFVPMLCDGVGKWFHQAAIDFAGLPDMPYQFEWGTPPFDLLDREAEAKADQIELQTGKVTWPQMISRQGEDPEKQIANIQKWKPRLDAAGVTFAAKTAAPNAAANGGTNG